MRLVLVFMLIFATAAHAQEVEFRSVVEQPAELHKRADGSINACFAVTQVCLNLKDAETFLREDKKCSLTDFNNAIANSGQLINYGDIKLQGFQVFLKKNFLFEKPWATEPALYASLQNCTLVPEPWNGLLCYTISTQGISDTLTPPLERCVYVTDDGKGATSFNK